MRRRLGLGEGHQNPSENSRWVAVQQVIEGRVGCLHGAQRPLQWLPILFRVGETSSEEDVGAEHVHQFRLAFQVIDGVRFMFLASPLFDVGEGVTRSLGG
jgi:hypothetical protein